MLLYSWSSGEMTTKLSRSQYATETGKGVIRMLKKVAAMLLALSVISLMAIAPDAHAKKRQGGCGVEDNGVDCIHGH